MQYVISSSDRTVKAMRGLSRFFSVILIAIQPAFAQDQIEVTNAWINEAPPTVKVLSGYLTVKNNSGEVLNLTKAHSPLFERIEFHLTSIKNGVASMHRQDTITIPAQSEFSFIPGNYHLMLFNPARAIKNGDKVSLTLIFSNGKNFNVEAGVRRDNPDTHHH